MEIITRIQVYLIWGMNFDSKQNGGKKHFLQNQSIKIMYPNEENMFIVSNHERNGDYQKNQSLSYLMNELWLKGKRQKQKLFLQNQSIKPMHPNE